MKKDSPASKGYREAHVGEDSWAPTYDETLFADGSFDLEVWRREQRLLDDLVQSADRYLDFACGTGRVLAHLEDRCGEAVGLDISPTMLDAARKKVKRATVVCGDGTRNPTIVEGPFDLITTFRFFLNAEPELRDDAMSFLVGKLRDESSRIIFNIHGNALSTRFPVWLNERLHNRPYHQMTYWQVRRFAERHGLEIRRWFGMGVLDKSIYNRIPKPLWSAVEKLLRVAVVKPFAVYLYFECGLAPAPPR